MAKLVKVYTIAAKPDYISLQARSFTAFCRDEHELIIINNGRTEEIKSDIQRASMCANVRCIECAEQNFASPCMANAVPLNWIWREYFLKNTDVISVVIDADMFLVGDFSFVRELGTFALAGVKQARQHIKYLWGGIIIADISKITSADKIDWRCGIVDGVTVDVGGYIYDWLKNNHEFTTIRISSIQQT